MYSISGRRDSRSAEGEPVAVVDNNRRDGTIYSRNEAKVVVDENRRDGTIYSRCVEGEAVAIVKRQQI
jgi:hypothetical protein